MLESSNQIFSGQLWKEHSLLVTSLQQRVKPEETS